MADKTKYFDYDTVKEMLYDLEYEGKEVEPFDYPYIEIADEHGDLADKSVIISRMGNAHDELWDKVDKKALSECHVAFLKAVMQAPTVLERT